jgi:hypothetical protein
VEIGRSKAYKRIFKKMKVLKEDTDTDSECEGEIFDFFSKNLDGTLSDVTLIAPKNKATHK